MKIYSKHPVENIVTALWLLGGGWFGFWTGGMLAGGVFGQDATTARILIGVIFAAAFLWFLHITFRREDPGK